MKSKFIIRRQKKATIQASVQTVQDALQIAQSLAETFMQEDHNDPRLTQIQNSVDFLSSILKKNPQEMAQDGVTSIEGYFDDAVKPDVAKKVKSEVDMIATMRRQQRPAKVTQTAPVGQPAMASAGKKANGAAFVTDRDEKGEPKAPEKLEVPRLAAKKKEAAPAAVPAAAPVAEAPKSAPIPEGGTFDITTLSSEALAKAIKALTSIKEFEEDKSAQALIEEMAAALKTRPIEQEEPKAAPAAAAPAPVGAAPVVAPAPLPVAASKKKSNEDPASANVPLGGLTVAAVDEESKTASGNGGAWFTDDGDTMDVKENGGRTPEIAEAHSKVDDNTGISRPATTKPIKLAAEMSVAKAVKQAEKLGADLKKTYLEAKSLTDVNDTRPVREAVEAIFRAANMFDEATKVLNKQQMQEQAEEEAAKVKDLNKGKKSSFFGLTVAAEEPEQPGSEEESDLE